MTIRIGSLLFSIVLFVVMPFVLFGFQLEGTVRSFFNATEDIAAYRAAAVLLLALDIFLPIPSSFVATATGYVSGLLEGTLIISFGLSIGCVLGFVTGQLAGPTVLNGFLSEPERKTVMDYQHRLGGLWIVFLRAVPVLAEASIIFAGLTRMPARRFLVLITLSNIGLGFVYAAAGAVSRQTGSLLFAVGGSIVLPLVAVGCVRTARLLRSA